MGLNSTPRPRPLLALLLTPETMARSAMVSSSS